MMGFCTSRVEGSDKAFQRTLELLRAVTGVGVRHENVDLWCGVVEAKKATNVGREAVDFSFVRFQQLD